MTVAQPVVQQLNVMEQFKALVNKTRNEIFSRLMTGAHCNCELSKALGIPLNLVSHHVHILLDLGLVNATRDSIDARWIYYSVDVQTLNAFRQAFLTLTNPEKIEERHPSCPINPCK